jgi:hypothetical protein
MTAEHDPVILDARCVMTLYGSGRMGDVLATLPTPVFVCDYVLEEEALTVYDGPPGNVRAERTAVDLRPFEQEGLIERTHLRSDEQTTFITLAREVDDGEARTIAIAIHRDWAVGTDDKKALRVCRSEDVDRPDVTTPELMCHWADRANPSREEVAEALRKIQTRTVYLPGSGNLSYDWWVQHSGN